MTRNGKIARLPRSLRDELNRRLAANEDGATLLDWLNAAPDVKDLLARDFAGEPISKENLDEWRHGGFLEWQNRQDLFAQAADLTDANGEWDALAANDFTERLAAVVVMRYADALAAWNGGDDEAFRLKLRDLRRFNQDLAVLRRYNQTAARLKMEQMAFYRGEKERAEAAAPARKPSQSGAHAGEEQVTHRRREAAAPLAVTPASSVSAATVTVLPAKATDQTAADLSVATVAVNPAPSQTDRLDLPSGNELPNRGSVGSNQVKPITPECRPSIDRSPATDSPTNGVTPEVVACETASDQSHTGTCEAGKRMEFGPAALAAGLNRANFVVELAKSLSHALMLIKEKSVNAYDLKDRRAVQSAYAGSVATINRLGQEAGWLRAELPGFAGVDRVYAAVEMLQREYLRMKANLFQGCSATIAVGIPRLRDAACELREALQREAATAASLAVRPS